MTAHPGNVLTSCIVYLFLCFFLFCFVFPSFLDDALYHHVWCCEQCCFLRGVITWTSETPEQAYSKYANVYHEINRNESVYSQDTLIISHHNILLNRTGNSLQRLVRLTLLVVVLHVLQRSKRRLDGEVEALVPGIGDRPAHGCVEDVGFSVLLLLE